MPTAVILTPEGLITKEIRHITIEDFPIDSDGIRGLPKCCGEILSIKHICDHGCHIVATCEKCFEIYMISLNPRSLMIEHDGPMWEKPHPKMN